MSAGAARRRREILAGLVLGWNFGDGHLHDERLLAAVQAQCGFEAGELRCIFVESQPLHRQSMQWRICDARDGELERGEVTIGELRALQPWSFERPAGSGAVGAHDRVGLALGAEHD